MSLIDKMTDILMPAEERTRRPKGKGGMVERAAGRLDEPVVRAPLPDDVGIAEHERREPQFVAPETRLPELPPVEPQAAARKSRSVQVDFRRLKELGCVSPDAGRTEMNESFRLIKRRLLGNMRDQGGQATNNLIMVTSAVPGEGKTFCSVNLAVSLAMEMDYTVLLVDADVARGSVPKMLGIEADRGLMDVLTSDKLDLADVMLKTDLGKLSVLPAGRPQRNATELLASDTMTGLLGELANRYSDRLVIFDSPPLLAASEAGVLAGRMGQIVMVVEAGKTSAATVKQALEHLPAESITGLLLNKGRYRPPGYHSYYGYGG